MATFRQMVDAFDTYIESGDGLGIVCIKGFPDFRQLNLTPPLAAIFYAGSQAGQAGEIRKRIGASVSAVVLTLGVYAANEVELFELAMMLQAIRSAKPVLSAGLDNQKIRVYVGDDERVEPEEDSPKEERHWVRASVVLAYE